jgi:hypothetical protein
MMLAICPPLPLRSKRRAFSATLRLARVQEKEEVKALLSLEEHMEELRVLREMAKNNNQLSAAITAEVRELPHQSTYKRFREKYRQQYGLR